MPSINDAERALYGGMLSDTSENYGSVTAPLAGGDIASVTLGPGYWEIVVIPRLGLGGTPAAADVDNVQLVINGVTALRLPLIATANSNPVVTTIRRKLTASSNTVLIEAVSAATASVVYIAHIICRKVADI